MKEWKNPDEIISAFLRKNYNYVWLKTMLEKGRRMSGNRTTTLITGSSHALNGIVETVWNDALNCSMHSQDLYYDFLCAKKLMEGNARFKRCLIVFGYYISYQDLSLSNGMREYIISPVYYPVFGDAHNWKEPLARDLWAGLGNISDEEKYECEKAAMQMIYFESTYYSKLKRRKPFFDFDGLSWNELEEEEQEEYAKQRAQGHNSVLKYENSYYENRQIFKDYIHFLHLRNIMPIVVIPPFSTAYNGYVDTALKEAVKRLIKDVSENISFMDFNEFELFDNSDFIDTDHLNEKGAAKMSRILVKKYGK